MHHLLIYSLSLLNASTKLSSSTTSDYSGYTTEIEKSFIASRFDEEYSIGKEISLFYKAAQGINEILVEDNLTYY